MVRISNVKICYVKGSYIYESKVMKRDFLGSPWRVMSKNKVYKCTPCAFLAKKITVSRGTIICMQFLLASRKLEVTEG